VTRATIAACDDLEVLGRTSADASRSVSTVSIVSGDLSGWCGRVRFPPIDGRC
jgi:hypothetical protein